VIASYVTSDADLRWTGSDWSFHRLRGAKRDRTRRPRFYNGVYDYLPGMGVEHI
jgi:hypothetical protein